MTGHKGFLISIEGIDGAGKTTHVQMLKNFLEQNCREVTILKEPTKGKWGKEISELAKAHNLTPEKELRLFILDRKADVATNIKPALKSGKIVIMDRYFYSNMAYQGARGLDVGQIKEENEKFAPVPDLLIILDIDPKMGMKRINKRNSILDHFENESYLEKVRKIFLSIGKEPNAVVIETDAPINIVNDRIIKAVKEKLPHVIDWSHVCYEFL